MKNYFKYLTILCVSLMFTSCLVDDVAESTINDEGPKLDKITSDMGDVKGQLMSYKVKMSILSMISDPLSHNSHFNVIVRCLHRRQLVN